MNNNYKIEKNIPMPSITGNKMFPLEEMEIGDSFLFESKKRGNLGHALRIQKEKGRLFKTRTIDSKNSRCWRVK